MHKPSRFNLGRLRLRAKIGLSFGVLMALMAFNALTGGVAAHAILGQVDRQRSVERSISDMDQVRLAISQHVNTPSRQRAEHVFAQLAKTRQQIDQANANLEGQPLAALLPLVEDLRRQFQQHVLETDQKAALQSHVAALGRQMVRQLSEARDHPQAMGMHATLDVLLSEIVLVSAGLQTGSPSSLPLPHVESMATTRAKLARLQARVTATSQRDDLNRLVFRVLRDATDYSASLEKLQAFEEGNARTELSLAAMSDAMEQHTHAVNGAVTQQIQRRIQTAQVWMAVLFFASLVCALGLIRVLTREILRPIQALAAVAQQVGAGNLDARAAEGARDEIGALSNAFNRMTQSLKSSLDGLEQRVAERTHALAARELVVRQVLDAAPIAIFLVDMSGRITQANAHTAELFGREPDALLGMEYVALVDPNEVELRRAKMLALMNGDIAIVDLDRRFVRANGEGFWAHLTGKLLCDADGKRLGLVGAIADISQRKLAEEKLQLAASVFTHAREGIMITDAAGTIVDVNDTFTRITGYGRTEVIGQNPRILKSSRQSADFYTAMWEQLGQCGHWTAEYWNRRKGGDEYAEMQTISAVHDEAGRVQHYVALFSDITAQKEHQRQLEQVAHYDPLTNLPNRVLLADRLQQGMRQAQRRQGALAVVYLDLDGFKAVNDTHGHDAGDAVLVTLAQRMRDALRESDTLARLGGDEFVAVLIDLTALIDCVPLLSRLLGAASSPVQVPTAEGPVVVQVSASVGVTMYPQDDADADLLLRHADQAMYTAKQQGKNQYHVFDLAHDAAIQVERESVVRVRAAMANHEFVLHYQPKVNMQTGRVIGAEALIRWQHPEQGLLPPGAFLPVLEGHALSIELGEWVIRTALAQMQAWQGMGLLLPVSVNIGALQLQSEGFPARLRVLLGECPSVLPASLQLEVLESRALDDMAQVGSAMAACQAIGVSFALDDFGTGYSSLTYLKRLPAKVLKIDQTFVRDILDDPGDLAIVNGVVGLAKAFGRDVIAEGVETRAHGDLLLSVGCENAQGHGIAKPMPATKVPDWVAGWLSGANWLA